MNKLLCSILLSLISLQASAAIAVIVHPSNADSIDQKYIENIYLGKVKSFPSGEQVVPINMDASQAAKETFDSAVLSKSASQLKAYWSKKMFTGKGTPPKEVSSTEDMIKLISSNPSMIGYIDSGSVNDTVKVVAEF
ncbi:phosphate ABC transporter substrate-binding protein [Shewanella sp. HL-SH8]|uniref:phosphate ABC transporter substrate-binding protein n=1 Tax=unclassified Shewanella TaxID=196818 RepID=UPI003EB7E86D